MVIANGDMPVTPIVMESGHPYHASQVCFENTPLVTGLTKREAFAMAAMQGLLSTEQGCNQRNMIITERAVEIADSLLKELS